MNYIYIYKIYIFVVHIVYYVVHIVCEVDVIANSLVLYLPFCSTLNKKNLLLLYNYIYIYVYIYIYIYIYIKEPLPGNIYIITHHGVRSSSV